MKNMAFLTIIALLASAGLGVSCSDNTTASSPGSKGIDMMLDQQQNTGEENGLSAWDLQDEQEYTSASGFGDSIQYGPRLPYRLTWLPNREEGVNSPGGGYVVYYSTKNNCPPEKAQIQRVPYTSGDLAPTETVLMLPPGKWHIRIAGYSRFNGGTVGTLSDEISVHSGDEE